MPDRPGPLYLPGDPEPALDAMIRVNHAGEFGAVRIYEGQLAVLPPGPARDAVAEMVEQEQRHLETFDRLIAERRVRPTLLSPIWRVAGFALGAVTARMGPRSAMACTVAVEEVIDDHYREQAARLGPEDADLKATIEEFRAEHGSIIVKPLFGNGGADVFHLKPDDENLGSLLEMFEQKYREAFIVQRYLPEVRQGDKRIILVDGVPAGGVARIPVEGDARANFHAGGGAQKTELTARERDICEQIGPALVERGLTFVGIDVIGDYLTEINVTSPTGIQEINRLDGVHVEKLLWDAIEGRLS